ALGSDATVHVDGSPRTLLLDGGLSGSAVLTKTGLGTLVMTQPNAGLTGGTVIREGVVTVNAASRIGTGPLTLSQLASRDTTLNLNNPTQAVRNLATSFTDTTGTRAQTINLNGTALTVTQTADTTFGSGAVP